MDRDIEYQSPYNLDQAHQYAMDDEDQGFSAHVVPVAGGTGEDNSERYNHDAQEMLDINQQSSRQDHGGRDYTNQ